MKICHEIMIASVIRTPLIRRPASGFARRSAKLSSSAARPNAAADEAKEEKESGSAKAKNPQTRDLYATLGITREATQTEIREAFYRRAKELHPDVNPSEEAKEEFTLAKEAFEKLKGKSCTPKHNYEVRIFHPRSA